MSTKKLVVQLLALAAVQTALTLGHFVHGAHVYDDPGRYHIVTPALFFFALGAVLVGLYLKWPGRATRWLVVAEIAFADVGLFGLYHGGFNHALKDLAYVFGTGAERLAEIFGSPDFTVPDDPIYELTGLAGLVMAGVIATYLVRFVRAARREA